VCAQCEWVRTNRSVNTHTPSFSCAGRGAWGVGRGAWGWGVGLGCGAWGVGRGAWGMGRGAWGVGCGAWGVGRVDVVRADKDLAGGCSFFGGQAQMSLHRVSEGNKINRSVLRVSRSLLLRT
jgi:hypothetical protein